MGVTDFSVIKRLENYPDFENLAHVIQHGLFMVSPSQKKNWINFKEFKTLPHALSLKLNDTSILHLLHLPFENYTGCLLNHGSYSKFCSSLLRSFVDLVQPNCRPSYNITHNEPYALPLNYF